MTIVIKSTPDFMPILTPSALKSPNPEQDWFLKEIALALSSGRNICPMTTVALDLSQLQDLPVPLDRLRMHHAIAYSHDYCDAAIDRVCQMLSKPPQKKSFGIQFIWGIGNWRKTLTMGVSFLAVTLLVGVSAIGFFGSQIKDVFVRSTSALGGTDTENGLNTSKGENGTDTSDNMGAFDNGKSQPGFNAGSNAWIDIATNNNSTNYLTK